MADQEQTNEAQQGLKVYSGDFWDQKGVRLGHKYMFGHRNIFLKPQKLQYDVKFMRYLGRDRTVFIEYLGRDGIAFMR